MITGKTESGFEFSIDEEIKDDMELLEVLASVDKGNIDEIPELMKLLLGPEQKTALYEYCRSEKGRVSTKKVMAELKSIFEKATETEGELKN